MRYHRATITLAWLLAWAALVLVTGGVPATALAADDEAAHRPNIIVILADDLGYGDVQSLHDRGQIATPHLDRLAAAGMIFTDAHSGSSVCTPTRYGLLTGRYAWRTRLQRGVLDGENDEPLIAADRLTVPGLLAQHGYHSACIGKWHLGFLTEPPREAPANVPGQPPVIAKQMGSGGAPLGSLVRGGPITRGFDLFFGCSNARTMASVIENDRVIERVAPIDVLPRLSRRAVEYIAARADAAKRGQPFCLYLPLTSPHTPIVPSSAWQGKSPLGKYGDFVMQTDAVVGEVLAAVRAHGLEQQTLVIFTADNGCSPQAGVDKLEQQGHFPSARYRGYKADIWEGGHRVPFLVRWPGHVAAGSRSNQLICLTDWMATCAELMQVKLPDNAGEDSVSFLPALLGKDAAPLREAVVHHSIQGKFAIRQGKWKLCCCAGSGGWSKGGDPQSPQLYDLAAEPGETKNRAQDEPRVVAALTKLLEQYIAEGRSTPGEKQANDVPVEFARK